MKNTTLGRRVQSAEGHEMVVVTEEQWDDDTEADDLLRWILKEEVQKERRLLNMETSLTVPVVFFLRIPLKTKSNDN